MATAITTFSSFRKLPAELRIKIWGLAQPDGAVVYQHDGGQNGLKYVRRIPGVLHACAESRHEYLERDNDNDKTKRDRKSRGHPVYTLSFRTRRMRGPATYFCAEIDTLWATQMTTVTHGRNTFALISKLDITPVLQHIMLPCKAVTSQWDLSQLCISFPKLKTLTIIMDLSNIRFPFTRVVTADGKVILKRIQLLVTTPVPEVDGQLVNTGFGHEERAWIDAQMSRITSYYTTFPITYPLLNAPQLKFRFPEQILQKEKITIPAPPEPEPDFDDDDEDEDDDHAEDDPDRDDYQEEMTSWYKGIMKARQEKRRERRADGNYGTSKKPSSRRRRA